MNFLTRHIQITADGSPTLSLTESGITYHSKHGALQESRHVFIKSGLHYFFEKYPGKPLSVFEAGWGTGLNSLLTWVEAEKSAIPIRYQCRELYPLTEAEFNGLHYREILSDEMNPAYWKKLHESPWEKEIDLSPYFHFKKIKGDIREPGVPDQFDLIYYDAFAPGAQPELWDGSQFKKLAAVMKENAVLVTYCSKGDVRRAMLTAGLEVEKIPGPPGKREMLRATKPFHPMPRF